MKMKITRDILFVIFNRLSFIEKEELYYHAKEIFLKNKLKIKSGDNKIIFNGKALRIPYYQGPLFNMATAFSYLGHDYDVKMCYQDLINLFGIKTFYDVGANYGQHTILMMSQGINCYSFEPNKNCHQHLIYAAKYNNFSNYKLIKKAVGSKIESLFLNFNSKETWNGKISTKQTTDVNETSYEVQVIKLDSFISENSIPDLIKIDTEGHEIQVLLGANNLIETYRPFIIFESLTAEILKFFKMHSYSVLSIINNYKPIINENESLNNFLACPVEKSKRINKFN